MGFQTDGGMVLSLGQLGIILGARLQVAFQTSFLQCKGKVKLKRKVQPGHSVIAGSGIAQEVQEIFDQAVK